MANITKKVLENYIVETNQRSSINLKLMYSNDSYMLYNRDNLCFTGSAKEIYVFLQGMNYILASNKKVQNELNETDDYSGEEYLRDKMGKQIAIRAKKISRNNYFSQDENKYIIVLEKLKNDTLYFTGVLKLYTPSGLQDGTSVSIPMCKLQLKKNWSIEEFAENILRKIDEYFILRAKADMTFRKNFRGEYVLWWKIEDILSMGWTNYDLKTEKVYIDII